MNYDRSFSAYLGKVLCCTIFEERRMTVMDMISITYERKTRKKILEKKFKEENSSKCTTYNQLLDILTQDLLHNFRLQ